MMRRLLLMAVVAAGLTVGPLYTARAQQYQRPVNLDFDLLIQELFTQAGGDDASASYEDLYENLSQYFQSPLNLNTATPEELGTLFILNPNQIASLQRHLRQHGALLSLYELQAVAGFDLPTIYKLAPLVFQQPARPDRRPGSPAAPPAGTPGHGLASPAP